MKDVTRSAEEEMLVEISDEELEAAAGVPGAVFNFTLGSCTDMSSCPA
jgi:hypothetical protein